MYSKSSGFYWNSSTDIQKAPTAALLRPRGLLEITFSEITYDHGRYVQLRPSAALLSGR